MLRSRLAALHLALALVIAAKPASAAWTHDAVNGGVPVSTAPNAPTQVATLADGSGGAFMTWSDYRNSSYQVYVQHLNAFGVAQWAANGVAVGAGAGQQFNPVLDTDGAGGVVVAWSDNRSTNYDIYAQRVTAAGTLAWAGTGVLLCSAAGDQSAPSIATDDAGGAYVGWVDNRPSSPGVFFNHVLAAGSTQYGTASAYAVSSGPAPYSQRVCRDGAGGFIMAWEAAGVGHDLYAARFTSAGVNSWFTSVCSAAGDQVAPTLCSDGAGGAIMAWQDKRTNANGDIYAQRIWYQGSPLWAANGMLVESNGTFTHVGPQTVPDGSGGAIVVWGDSRVGFNGPAAQHVNSNGTLVWTSAGVTLGQGTGSPYAFSAGADGFGGVLVTYLDSRAGIMNAWAGRLNASGVAQWAAQGVAVDANPAQVNEAAACADGRGGLIAAFIDLRNGSGNPDLFATHVDSWGIQGAEPVLAGVKDVPNDNGGHVKVSWYASPLEADPASVGVQEYLVFRSAPSALAATAARSGRVTTSAAAAAAAPAGAPLLLASPAGAGVYFWEYVTSQNAYHLSGYSVVAPTTGDSMGVGNPKTAFLIQAHNTSNSDYWYSAPDSGYSVDNVPPVAPAPFTGTYSAGSATLHWNPNPDADLANYRLYRGTSPLFAIAPANLVATPADTGFVDAAGAPYYYKLTAVDVHGNESPAALLAPAGTAGVGGPLAPRELALASPMPNPARASAAIAFTLPVASRVRLEVFDAAGRIVRTLADGARDAGAASVTFDLRDDRGGPLGAGLYLVRLEAGGQARVRRLAVTR